MTARLLKLMHGLGALRTGLRLTADGFEVIDLVLARWVVQIDNARFEGVVESLEVGFRQDGDASGLYRKQEAAGTR